MAIALLVIALIVFTLFLGYISSLNKGNKDNETEGTFDAKDYLDRYLSRDNADISTKKKIEIEKDRAKTTGGTKRD